MQGPISLISFATAACTYPLPMSHKDLKVLKFKALQIFTRGVAYADSFNLAYPFLMAQ